MSRVLAVDDESGIRAIITQFLKMDGHECIACPDVASAQEALREQLPDVIVCDIVMPGKTGLELLEHVRELDAELPVLMLTGQPSVETAAHSVQKNAFDYLTKPIRKDAISAAVARAGEYRAQVLERRRLQKENEQYRNNLERLVSERTTELQQTVQQLKVEANQRREAEEELQYVALHDVVTRLPNRILFKERLRSAIAAAAESPGETLTVVAIGLSGAILEAQQFGESGEEELFGQFVSRVLPLLSESETMARISRSEFAILPSSKEGARPVKELELKIRASVSNPFLLEDQPVSLNLRVGVYRQTPGKQSADEVLQDALLALNVAREEKSDSVAYFSPGLRRTFESRLQVEGEFREALFRTEIRPFYQPIVDVATSEALGFEALARWTHPERGEISPAQFIPIAERNGAIIPLGEYILERACAQLKRWRSKTSRPLCMHVNISARQLVSAGIVTTIERIIESTEIDPHDLVLELTESSVFAMGSKVVVNDIRSLGVRLCIDDFGTGYSSLSYLHQLPIEKIKLDQSFVRGLPGSVRSAAIVRTVATLADSFGLELVAEGVETEEQRDFLQNMGYKLAQGYLFGRPASNSSTTSIWFPELEEAPSE